MPENIKTSKHQLFLDAAAEIEMRRNDANLSDHLLVTLTPAETEAILNHAEWLRNYVTAQSKRATDGKNSGRKKLPDSEVKPASLLRRQQRANEKKIKEQENKKKKKGDLENVEK